MTTFESSIESGVRRRTRAFVVPDEGRSVTLRAVEWSRRRSRPILLLHGGGANAEWWSHLAPTLADHGLTIALDLRGHGESDYTPGRYGLGIFATDVQSVIEQLGTPVSIVGASMGGLVAMLVAARSDRIDRVVVVDSPLRPPAQVSERRQRLAAPKRYASREEAVRRFRLIPSGTTAAPELVRRIAESSVRPSDDGSWTLKFDPGVFTAPRRRGVETVVSRIRAPLLYLRGERSEVVDEVSSRAIVESIPGARSMTLPRTHHHLYLDDPSAFLEAILPFLTADTGERTSNPFR